MRSRSNDLVRANINEPRTSRFDGSFTRERSRMMPSILKISPVLRSWFPKTLRPHTILTGPLRGQRMVTSWHDYPAGIAGVTERPLVSWLTANVKTGETWLDVGAHYGYTAIALSTLVGRSGRVFAFEPMLETVQCLKKTRSLNGLDQLTVVPHGLAAPATIARLSLPSTRGMADWTLGDLETTRAESIEIARFDWLWPQINGGNPAIHGIKIDVQGMELDTLAGMQQTLTRHRPKLVIELHRGVSRPAVLEWLAAANYSRTAVAVEPAPGEREPLLLDDRSYAFSPA
jgi:FkbM family methyltransferase